MSDADEGDTPPPLTTSPHGHVHARKTSSRSVADDISRMLPTVSLSIPKTEERFMKGQRRKYTVYVIQVCFTYPVVVTLGDSDKNGKHTKKVTSISPRNSIVPSFPHHHSDSSLSVASHGFAFPDPHAAAQEDEDSAPEDEDAKKAKYGVKRKLVIIDKRYSEFLAFHQNWTQKYPDILLNKEAEHYFQLPAKKWFFNNFKQSVLEERRVGLERYLQALSSIRVLAGAMCEFLGLKREEWNPVAVSNELTRTETFKRLSLITVNEESRKGAGKGDDDGEADTLMRPLDRRAPDDSSTMLRPGSSSSSLDLLDVSEEQAEAMIARICSSFRLLKAVCDGDLTAVKEVVATGLDVNTELGYYRRPALVWAMHRQHKDVVDYLLSQGAKLPAEEALVPPVAEAAGIHAWRFQYTEEELKRQRKNQKKDKEKEAVTSPRGDKPPGYLPLSPRGAPSTPKNKA